MAKFGDKELTLAGVYTTAMLELAESTGQADVLLDEWRDLIVPWGLSVTEKDEIWVCGSSPMVWPETGMLGCPPKDQVFMKFNPDGKLLPLWTVPKGDDGKDKRATAEAKPEVEAEVKKLQAESAAKRASDAAEAAANIVIDNEYLADL